MQKGLIAIAALTLCGCSAGAVFDLPVRQAAAEDSAESYYKYLIADNSLTRRLRANTRMAPLQISPLRRSVAPQPGDWMTCMRAWELGKQETYYAIFIRDRQIIETRSGIGIDRCESQPFSPLPAIYVPPREPPPPPPPAAPPSALQPPGASPPVAAPQAPAAAPLREPPPAAKQP